MPRGGNRKEKAEANGKKVGRPRNPVLAMEAIYKDFTQDVKEFRSKLQRGYAGGIAVMAQRFPELVERQVKKALDEDDGDAQRFLIERFLKVVQPESMGGDSPAAEFLRQLRESFAKPVAISGGENPAIVETRPEPDGNGGVIFRPMPAETGDGGREVG